MAGPTGCFYHVALRTAGIHCASALHVGTHDLCEAHLTWLPVRSRISKPDGAITLKADATTVSGTSCSDAVTNNARSQKSQRTVGTESVT
eukprot:165944-Amphidinium_carterae.1